MAFESDFLELMKDVIQIQRFIRETFDGNEEFETDGDGNPVYHEYRCRIAGKGLALRRQQGQDDAIIVDIWAYVGDDVLNIRDRLILPPDAAWIDQTPEIFAIGRYTDDDPDPELRQHHAKIQCGWMYHRQGQ